MGKNRTLRNDKGQFAGSEGAGKGNVPSADPRGSLPAPPAGGPQPGGDSDVDSAYARYLAAQPKQAADGSGWAVSAPVSELPASERLPDGPEPYRGLVAGGGFAEARFHYRGGHPTPLEVGQQHAHALLEVYERAGYTDLVAHVSRSADGKAVYGYVQTKDGKDVPDLYEIEEKTEDMGEYGRIVEPLEDWFVKCEDGGMELIEP